MPRPKVDANLNLDDVNLKRRFISWIGTLRGFYDVLIEPKRNTRSLAQNAYYWKCICEPFAAYLSGEGYERITKDAAHEIFRDRFLSEPVIHPRTGKRIGTIRRSTAKLSTVEKADYIERCRAWMLDWFCIITNDPDPAWREAKKPQAAPVASNN